jgi:hypothetical protein
MLTCRFSVAGAHICAVVAKSLDSMLFALLYNKIRNELTNRYIPAGVKADSFKKGRRAESVPPSLIIYVMSSNFERMYI